MDLPKLTSIDVGDSAFAWSSLSLKTFGGSDAGCSFLYAYSIILEGC